MLKKINAKLTALSVLGLSALPAFAQATDPFEQMMDGVNLTGISAAVIAAGLLIVGIAVAFKAPDVAKRVVRKV